MNKNWKPGQILKAWQGHLHFKKGEYMYSLWSSINPFLDGWISW